MLTPFRCPGLFPAHLLWLIFPLAREKLVLNFLTFHRSSYALIVTLMPWSSADLTSYDKTRQIRRREKLVLLKNWKHWASVVSTPQLPLPVELLCLAQCHLLFICTKPGSSACHLKTYLCVCIGSADKVKLVAYTNMNVPYPFSARNGFSVFPFRVLMCTDKNNWTTIFFYKIFYSENRIQFKFHWWFWVSK